MNPSSNEGHKTIRPLKQAISSAANRADCAAEEVEEGLQEPEPKGPGGEPDHSCGVCGEEAGIRGTVSVETL